MEITDDMYVVVGLVMTVLQVFKQLPQAEKINPYLPLLGIPIAFFILYAQNPGIPLVAHITPAIIIGLMASGAYKGIKAISPNRNK